jgi:DNA replication protein DnaC
VSDAKPVGPMAQSFLERLAERDRLEAERVAALERTEEGRAQLAAERARREAAERKARAHEEAQKFYAKVNAADAAHLPDEAGLRGVALDDEPTPTEALAAFREAMVWRGPRRYGRGARGLVRLVAGPPGTGKSCALAWVTMRHGGVYATAAAIVATPRNGWSANEEKWERWLAVDLLAIDEVGCERGDPAAIVYLLGERYNQGRATLLAGNLKRVEFQQRYADERLADRLVNGQGHGGAATGLAWYVGVKGESLRAPDARAALTGTDGAGGGE